MIECIPCGREVPSRRPDGLYCDGDQLPCECGAVMLVSFDGEEEEPYICGWWCEHGKPPGVECATCDEGWAP